MMSPFVSFFTMAIVAISVQFASAQTCGTVDTMTWKKYKTQFNLCYTNATEDAIRQAAFEANLALVNAHNADCTQTYSLAINKYSLLTPQEFAASFTGVIAPPDRRRRSISQSRSKRQVNQLVDWRLNGAVTPVKNQGACGSCWTFATTGAIESSYFLATGNLVSLSEQFLVDCDNTNTGCRGGWPNTAMSFIQNYGGIPTEAQYPYTSGNGVAGTCQASPSLSGITITGITQINNEVDLTSLVSNNGPVAIAVDAAHGCNWQQYSGGIFNQPGCYQKLDHAVLAVGYTKSDGYWIIKNQWGEDWGEGGYIRVAYGGTYAVGMSGVGNFGVFPSTA